MATIIGLSGYARSGKDTVADYLVGYHGFTKTSFADPMREALLRLDPNIDLDGYRMHLSTALTALSWEEIKARSTEIRGLLQRLGTDVVRDMLGQDLWVEYAMSRLDADTPVVFADVRFVNEANAIKLHGGQVWRINRTGTGAVNGHPSETALDGYDFDKVIDNGGDLTQLFMKAGLILGGFA